MTLARSSTALMLSQPYRFQHGLPQSPSSLRLLHTPVSPPASAALVSALTRSLSSGTEMKGSCENILNTKNFSVNIISEPFVEAANYTSIDTPKGTSEWIVSGLTPVKSKLIDSPRVGESAFSMECELGAWRLSVICTALTLFLPRAEHSYDVKNDAGTRTGTIVLGRVKLFHVRDDIIDPDSLIVDTNKLMPVSRLGGITYGRTTSVYETPRPVWKTEQEREEVKEAIKKGEWKAKA